MSEPYDQGNPMTSAQQMMRPVLPKRFYKQASFAPVEAGFALTLDGRTARTPARKPLVLPREGVAAAVAAEWQEQVEVVDPSRMPITRLANSVIDGIADNLAAITDEITRYAASDLLCYRAHGPQDLVDEQVAAWDGPLSILFDRHGVDLQCAYGIMAVEQSPEALARFRTLLPQDPWIIGALHVVTTLTGSAVLAVVLMQRHLDAQAVWTAAHVDEDFQIVQWGEDEEAERRRAHRRAEFDAAAKVLALLVD